MKNKKGFSKFFVGAALGAGLGVLFAPKKGSETRKEIKEKLDDMVLKAKEINYDEVKENIINKIEEIKTELASLDKEKVNKMAKEKAELLKKKAEELVNLAKERGTPVLEKMANEVREKTSKLLVDMSNKVKPTKSS